MLFRIVVCICYFFFSGFYMSNSFLFKGFIFFPVWLSNLVLYFFDFYFFSFFKIVVFIYISIFLNIFVFCFLIIYFLYIKFFYQGMKLFNITSGINESTHIYFYNFKLQDFAKEQVRLSAPFSDLPTEQMYFFESIGRFSRHVHRLFGSRRRYVRNVRILSNQAKKSRLETEDSFFARYYIKQRSDYIRTRRELYLEAVERHHGRLLPSYGPVQYMRIFRDSYREYFYKFYPKFEYKSIQKPYNSNFFSYENFVDLNSNSFVENFFLFVSNYVYLFVSNFERYAFSEFGFFLKMVSYSLFNYDVFCIFNFNFFTNTLSVFVYSCILYIFFFSCVYFSNFNQVGFIGFFRFRLIFNVVFSVFCFIRVFFSIKVFSSLRNFGNLTISIYEFCRFKKFRAVFPDNFNYRVRDVFKKSTYDSSEIYSSKPIFSSVFFNPLRFTYPGFESWDSVDYMLNPVEFNLYYSNYPFNFYLPPSTSIYRTRFRPEKFKNKLNFFFVNEFSFPFTFFEENFTRLSSYINRFVFFFLYYFFYSFYCFGIV